MGRWYMDEKGVLDISCDGSDPHSIQFKVEHKSLMISMTSYESPAGCGPDVERKRYFCLNEREVEVLREMIDWTK